MAPAALINFVVSGEIPLSPTIFDANVTLAKQKGAPVEWRPLEPVVATVGYSGLRQPRRPIRKRPAASSTTSIPRRASSSS